MGPVAVGEVLRRIVSKVLSNLPCMRLAAADMEPTQCGLHMPGACELIGQTTSLFVNTLFQEHPEGDWAVLQVDLSNAFNCVSRTHMLQAFKSRCPEAAHWMATSYGAPALLFSGSQIMMSTSGVQQGDNMGPAGFCLAVHDLLESFDSMEGLFWQTWYMDDGTLVGPLASLERVLQALQSAGPALGLHLNAGKCVLWGPGATAEAVQSHPRLSTFTTRPFTPDSGIRPPGR